MSAIWSSPETVETVCKTAVRITELTMGALVQPQTSVTLALAVVLVMLVRERRAGRK